MRMCRADCVVMLAAALVVGGAGRAAAQEAACAGLAGGQVAGAALEIVSADWIPKNSPRVPPTSIPPGVTMPGFCRVDGVLNRRAGVGGVEYGIGFALAMPEGWNGRLLFQGGAGFDGSVRMPLGQVVVGRVTNGVTPALANGFAVVSMDSGHEGGPLEVTFLRDQQAVLDYAYQAIERVTVTAQEIVRRYYGRPPAYNYLAGCSAGGRQALVAAQRFPALFNGVLAGAPSLRIGDSTIAALWNIAAFNRIAPRDAEGRPVPTASFSPEDRDLLARSVTKACDGQDGLEDGMILNPMACRYDPAVLACSAGKTASCLTAKQVDAFKTAMAGPRDSRGAEVYPATLYDTGSVGGNDGMIPSGRFNFFRLMTPSLEVDVDAQARAASRSALNRLSDPRWMTNMTSFAGRGGKMILFHGTSDITHAALDTIGFLEETGAATAASTAPTDWTRLYLVPGLNHCYGGPAALDQFDLLTTLVDWVERGTAPASVTATSSVFPGRSRPLCPYPAYAQYRGSGNPERAASFECRVPPAQGAADARPK